MFTRGFALTKNGRMVAMLLVVLLTGPFSAPRALAQGSGNMPLTADGQPGQPPSLPPRSDGTRPASDGEYVSDVRGRVALRDHLQARYRDEDERRRKTQDYIQVLRAATPPPGADPAAFERFRQEELRAAEGNVASAERAQTGIGSRLATLGREILNDQAWIKQNPGRGISQELGPLIGTAGAAFIPVANRPTIGSISRAGQQTSRVTNQTKLSQQILDLFKKRETSVTRLSTVQPPATRTQWVTEVNPQGNLQLRNGQAVIDLKQPAQIKGTDGKMIRNEAGYTRATQMMDLQTTRANVDTARATLEFEKSRASDTTTVKKLDRQIAELDAKKAKLSSEIEQYNGKNPKQGSALANLAGSAAKWAAFSAGMTVATSVVQQLSQNGWNPGAVDWKGAIQPLKTAEFWGGTAGSFGVSMLAAMIPGGAFIKTFAAIGGAAVGWQLGTGNLFKTDWLQLGVSTLGATIGSVLGASIGGPIGGFIGGIAGQMLANWGLRKLRDYLDKGADAHASQGPVAYDGHTDPYQNLSQYTGRDVPPSAAPSTSSGAAPAATEYSQNSVAELRQEMDRNYNELQVLTQSGGDRNRIIALQQRLQALNTRLQQLRQMGPRDERENVRN